tara:strand:- start:7139 stop:7411 length:273 start_codon:yes stop_codon:yes gene_type:complete
VEVSYDLHKHYDRSNQGQSGHHWDWDTWDFIYDWDVFTQELTHEEVLEIFNQEINHCDNVPEPNTVSFILVGTLLLVLVIRRIGKKYGYN